MADPLSVAASVASLVGVGVRLSTGLYDVCETISSAQDDIEGIASDLTSFVVVVDELGKIFAAPGRIYSDKLESNLLSIIKKCRHVFRQINRMIEKTVGATKMKLQSKVAWVFRKSKVQELKASLDSLKLTMGLMLQTLKLVKDHQQDNKEERQVLGNLLRSQTRSVKVLRDLENKQERKPRANRASRSKKPPGPEDGPLPTTAEVLSDAIPSLPSRTNLNISPGPLRSHNVDSGASFGKEASQQNSNFDCRQGGLGFPSVFERSLGSHYPLWRERAPEHVEVLVSQWTQPSHEPTQPARDSATTREDSGISGDAEYLLETKQIEDENAALEKLESEAKVSRNGAEERLQKIEERLKKREIGWLEIDDKALARLMDETKILREALESKTTTLESYALSREKLKDRVEAATESFYARRKAKEGEEKKANQPLGDNTCYRQLSNNRLSDYETFIEQGNLVGSDSDTDSDTDSEPDIEESTSQNGNAAHRFSADYYPSRLSNITHGSSLSIPSSEKDTATSSSTTVVDDSPPKSSIFSLGSTNPLTSDVNDTATSSKVFPDPCVPPETCNPTTCIRKAWKPPQPFLKGYNTFSHVLGTAKHVCLWFTASQDAYNFYLGDQETSFYNLHLVPDDLRTYDTSRVEWTVIEKPWATAKTLHAMNLAYMEDAVGFIWIRKELNWHQINQLFDFTCVILDNAINESAQNIIRRRSEDAKRLSSLEKSFMSLRRDYRDEKKAQSMSMYEQHRAFFPDYHLQQSNSKPSRLLRSIS